MECNKDEAIKCKQIAENKLEKEDLAGAKKFALKAQSLYPNLEGLSSLLAVVEFYITNYKKINGELNYYTILDANPSDDEDTLRKKYKKKILTVHPDKNKSHGAREVYDIVAQAWDVLSDKDRRSAYNEKLSLATRRHSLPTNRNGVNPQPPPPPPPPPAQSRTSAAAASAYEKPPEWPKQYTAPNAVPRPRKTKRTTTGNSGHNAAPPPAAQRPKRQRTATTAQTNASDRQKAPKTTTNPSTSCAPPQTRNQTTTSQQPPASKPQPTPCPPSGRVTFWTLCDHCRLLFEYPIIYLNQPLLCQCCRNAFLALEKPAPSPESIRSSPGCCTFHHQKPVSSAPYQIPHTVEHVYESLKRWHEGTGVQKDNSNIASSSTNAASGFEKPIDKMQVDGQKWNDVHNMAARRTSLKI